MDLPRLLDHLAPSDKDAMKQKAISNLNGYICPFCLDHLKVPVRLKSPTVHCADCGDERMALGCLRCVRTWLQLNDPPTNRDLRYHLICKKAIETRYLNASKAYTVDMKLLQDLDDYTQNELKCECGVKFVKRADLYTHMKDGTCTESYLQCPIRPCKYHGKITEILHHLYSGNCHRLQEMVTTYNP